MLELKQIKNAANAELSDRLEQELHIDFLIDNSDRNNGNWGLLQTEDTNDYQLAPVYDNGNAFSSKERKEYYALGVKVRYEMLIKPWYDALFYNI